MSLVRQQQRRDTTANWVLYNPVLLDGELGLDTTVDRFKVGDGVQAWEALPYADRAEQVAADAARAETAAAGAVDISGISTSDDVVEALVAGTAGAGPKTRAALLVSISGRPAVTLSSSLPTLKAAVAFIKSISTVGGDIRVPEGRWRGGVWTPTDYMDTANIRVIGAKMPRLSANCDRLEGGSVIEGHFYAFADGLEVTDIGFDQGKYVVDTYYGGVDTHTNNHPDSPGGAWDSFAIFQPNQGAPLPNRRGVIIRNVIGLARDSQSYGHAMLMEGIDGGTVDNVTGVGAIHGCVIKSVNMAVGRMAGYASSSNCVIIKSDTYAPCGSVTVETIDAARVPPGTAPWFTPATTATGVHLDATASFAGPLTFGVIRVNGTLYGLRSDGANANNTVADVSVGVLATEGNSPGVMVAGLAHAGSRALRFVVGKHIANNSQFAVSWQHPTSSDVGQEMLHVNTLIATNIQAHVVQAQGYARVVVDNLSQAGNTATSAYYIDDTAIVHVGTALLRSVAAVFGRNPPVLLAWGNVGGANSSFAVALGNYSTEIRGLVTPGTGATQDIAQFPTYLRSAEVRRFSTIAGNGTSPRLVIVGTGGLVSITGPLDNYVTLDGIKWPLGA